MSTTRFTIRITEESKKEAKRGANSQDISLNDWISEAIQLKIELEQQEGAAVKPRGGWPYLKLFKDERLIGTPRLVMDCLPVDLHEDEEKEGEIYEAIEKAQDRGGQEVRAHGSTWSWELRDLNDFKE